MREYDERVLRIDFNHKRGMHYIICKDPINGEEYSAMSVPAGQLDARVERRMEEINPRHFNAMKDINEFQEMRDRHEEKKVEDMARDMAETFYEPLIRDALGA